MNPKELQQQLAELMKVVTEERKLHAKVDLKRAEAERKLAAKRKLAEARMAAATAAATAAASDHGRKAPKISAPDKYDGTRGAKAEVYVSQIGLYVIANPHLFPNDRSKVIFLISYLTGPASVWAQPMTQRLFNGGVVEYEEFSTAFNNMYYDTEKKTRAEKALRMLRQRQRGRRPLK
jgi:nucleoid-associated protein YgaU